MDTSTIVVYRSIIKFFNTIKRALLITTWLRWWSHMVTGSRYVSMFLFVATWSCTYIVPTYTYTFRQNVKPIKFWTINYSLCPIHTHTSTLGAQHQAYWYSYCDKTYFECQLFSIRIQKFYFAINRNEYILSLLLCVIDIHIPLYMHSTCEMVFRFWEYVHCSIKTAANYFQDKEKIDTP